MRDTKIRQSFGDKLTAKVEIVENDELMLGRNALRISCEEIELRIRWEDDLSFAIVVLVTYPAGTYLSQPYEGRFHFDGVLALLSPSQDFHLLFQIMLRRLRHGNALDILHDGGKVALVGFEVNRTMPYELVQRFFHAVLELVLPPIPAVYCLREECGAIEPQRLPERVSLVEEIDLSPQVRRIAPERRPCEFYEHARLLAHAPA